MTNSTQKQIFLIHGIRTNAMWQDDIKQYLQNEQDNVSISPIGYGYFNVFLFLIPFFRKIAIHKVETRLMNALDNNADVFMIAHSFGTYITVKLLEKYPNKLKPKLLILCGSVIDSDYNLSRFTAANIKIINDYATRDIWPCLARSITFGFGNSGTFGFKNPVITERKHPIQHSDYFQETIYKIWKNDIFQSEKDNPYSNLYSANKKNITPSLWLNMFSMRPLWIPWIIIPILLLLIFFFVPTDTSELIKKTIKSPFPKYVKTAHSPTINENCATEMHHLAKFGGIEEMSKLIKNGKCDVNQFVGDPPNEGNTALHIAAEYCQLDMMKFLLENGAIDNMPNKHGDTPSKIGVQSQCVTKMLNQIK